MEQEEELKKMQEELFALRRSLEEQAQRIAYLQRRVSGIQGTTQVNSPITNERLPVKWNLENFIGLKLIHLVGIVVLVTGLSIGVKFAIDKNLVSETMRIMLAYAAGFILYFLSVRLKTKYNFFSAILFSGAMASIYFTTYAAFVYYAMFPFFFAFAAMAVITIFTVWQAISYNRQEIAIVGLVGAYAIPFLISVNAERIDLFFLYIAVINAGVCFLAFKKGWRLAARIAQAITWILVMGWASIRYDAKFQWIAIVFITFFFLLFSLMSVSRLFRKIEKLSINDIYQLILNNVALYICAILVFGYVKDTANIAMITLFNAALAATEAIIINYTWREKLTSRMLAALSFSFFIFFIAFQWDGLTVTMLWLFTAVIVFAAGYRFHSVAARMAAMALMGLTLLKLLLLDSNTFTPIQKIISYIVLGILLLVVSFFYQKFKADIFKDDSADISIPHQRDTH
jgi:uncharacterized membrane protein